MIPVIKVKDYLTHFLRKMNKFEYDITQPRFYALYYLGIYIVWLGNNFPSVDLYNQKKKALKQTKIHSLFFY